MKQALDVLSQASPGFDAAADPARAGRVRFEGRILFLSTDAGVVQRQLGGEDVSLAKALPLRTDVSTDEITPAYICYHFDEKLGDYPYLGLKCGEVQPVKAGSVKAGGFGVTVAGRRYGKGSSREASPYAEWCAGIRLVIAGSFERIYRQNCRNLGIFTSTDFGLIERIRRGESIPVEEFTQGEDELTAELIRRGGLFRLTRARRAGWAPAERPTTSGPMTYAEKIIARARAGAVGAVRPRQALFARVDWRYAHEYVSPMSISALEREAGADVVLHDPSSIVCFADHLTFIHRSMPASRRALGLLDTAQAMAQLQQRFCERYGLRLHGFLPDREGSEGISHSIMAERYVRPGQLVVGTDSHTPHCGALGALAFGIGATEMANAWMTGEVRIEVPRTCRVRLNGRLPPGVEAKDIVLHLLRLPYVCEGQAIGQVFEYGGEVLSRLSTDERATLTNMVAEIGGFSGIVVPDEETRRFLRERRGEALSLEAWMCSDEGAEVAHTIEVDCSCLEPMLARPGDPGLGLAVSALAEPVRVDIAYGGSCTGGKREDLQRYHAVLKWAVDRGLRVAPGTRFVLVVNPKVPARNAKELQALLKARPGGYNFGSSGNGTIIHLAGALFNETAGVEVRHIPYKGMGPMVADLIGGQIEMAVVSVPVAQPYLRSGALRAIGVMGRQRVQSLPEVPTLAEQGFPEVDIAGWFAVVGPAKLPAAQVKRLHRAVIAAFSTPETLEAMAKQQNVVNPTTPEVAAQFFRSEQERYARLVKKADVKLD